MAPSRGIHRLAAATAAATFVLLFVGGLVTSTGSGLAVPDWPLSFGQLVLGALMRHMGAGLAIPDFPLAFGRVFPPLATPYIAIHFAHRVGALVVALAVAATVTHVLRTQRTELGRPALLAATLVIVQVGLGASVIWTRRAVVPTTAHLAVGAALLATCVALTLHAVRLGVRRSVRTVPIGFRREVPA